MVTQGPFFDLWSDDLSARDEAFATPDLYDRQSMRMIRTLWEKLFQGHFVLSRRRSSYDVALLNEAGVHVLEPLLFITAQGRLRNRERLATEHIEQSKAVWRHLREGTAQQPQTVKQR